MALRHLKLWIASVALVASFPVFAQLDTTLRATNMHAGPDAVFPQVMRLPIANGVHVIGCEPKRVWCDVQSGRTRGWVRVVDLRPSDRIGRAPEVTFSVSEYWGTHYRSRPWFSRRDDWMGWGTPEFKPPQGRTRY